MATQVHPSQILSTSLQYANLHEQIVSIQTKLNGSEQDVNVSFVRDSNGSLTKEIIKDLSGNVIQTTDYGYDGQTGDVLFEKVTKGTKVTTSTFIYDADGNVSDIQIRYTETI